MMIATATFLLGLLLGVLASKISRPFPRRIEKFVSKIECRMGR